MNRPIFNFKNVTMTFLTLVLFFATLGVMFSPANPLAILLICVSIWNLGYYYKDMHTLSKAKTFTKQDMNIAIHSVALLICLVTGLVYSVWFYFLVSLLLVYYLYYDVDPETNWEYYD